jgi:signal transduction histidine kinase
MAELDGQFQLDSRPGHGTAVRLTIPLVLPAHPGDAAER